VAYSIEKIYPEPMTALPPLHALRAFESAARHLSMKEAAVELSVTPGAVSQLVRGLEQRLGTQLFRRGNRSLVLTEAGQAYFAPVRHAFRQIDDATRRLRSQPGAGVLTVSAPPAFAASWLVPRLGGFRTRYPDIELNIVTTRGLANFASDAVDVAIRHGLGRYVGLRCDRIVTIAMVPVCSRRFLTMQAARPLRLPADLLGLPLLHDAERQDWALWFQAHGVTDFDHAILRGVSFDDQNLLIRAAESDQGMALVSEPLARPELEQGRLVRVLRSPGRRSSPIGWSARVPLPNRRRSPPSGNGCWLRSARSTGARVEPGEQHGSVRPEALVVRCRFRQRTHGCGQAGGIRGPADGASELIAVHPDTEQDGTRLGQATQRLAFDP
jgi:LysR family glycine cleavage system transcriptional activator